MPKKLIEIASEIVQTQVSLTPMTASDINLSLREVFQTLQAMQKAETGGTVLAPQMMPEGAPKAIAPQDSIQDDKVICLECGAEMRQLTTKHLVSHGLSQKEYRKKYGFTMRTPLAAKYLTKARSKTIKKRGLPEKLRQYQEARRQGKEEASKPAATETVTDSKPMAAEANQEALLKEKPALTPENSIQNDKVICLECGAEFKQLTQTHLSSHGMSPKEYKRKYGFSMKTSLLAKSLTMALSKAAKKRGLPEKLKASIEARRQKKVEAITPSESDGPGAQRIKKVRQRFSPKKTP